MKIIHITDTHLVDKGQRLYNLDPAQRLAAVLTHVRDTQADADLLTITGDLTDRGEPGAYAMLGELLSDLPMPVRLLLGNHDDRAAFGAAFPGQSRDPGGYVQSVQQVPGLRDRLVFLDTNSPGENGGRFCESRANWLREALAEAPDAPLVVFLHHPPMDHGMRHFDNINFHDAARLMEVLDAHPGGVRHMFFGHIHIPFSGVMANGMGFTGGRGCSHQFRQEFENPAPDWIAGVPNYGIINITADMVTWHGVDTIEGEFLCATTPCAGP